MAEESSAPRQRAGLEAAAGMPAPFPGAGSVPVFRRGPRDGAAASPPFTRGAPLASGGEPSVLRISPRAVE